MVLVLNMHERKRYIVKNKITYPAEVVTEKRSNIQIDVKNLRETGERLGGLFVINNFQRDEPHGILITR